MCTLSEQKPLLVLVATATMALVMLSAVIVFPGMAHATFRDVADSFPAAQDLGEYQAPITGDKIPDGTYQIGARTTSRMCIMYTNPADAEARDSKEQAVLSVSGGSMTVLFYISKAYTHLYMGTQEEAVAATNAEGTDASAYIAGDPDEGYVPHLFAISVPALNSPMTISTFSGGDHGIEEGRWYTRQVVFTMTEAELQSIIDTGQTEASTQEEAATTASTTSSENQTTSSSGPATIAESQSNERPQASSSAASSPDALRGIRLNTAGMGGAASVPEVEQVATDSGKTEQTIPVLPLLLGVGFAIAFAGGAALRAAAFARQRNDRGKDKQE